MDFKIVDGEIRIDLSDLARDPDVLKMVAAHSLFEEWVINAISGFLVTGECQWREDDSPWWIGAGTHKNAFETARQKVAALAPEITRKLIADLTECRDSAVKDYKEWFSKAHDAEQKAADLLNTIRILKIPASERNEAEEYWLVERGHA
jgi:hypothetical protein